MVCRYISIISRSSSYIKVMGQGQGHRSEKLNFLVIFLVGHNFGSICRTDFQLVSYSSLWKNKITTLVITFVLFVTQNSNLSHIVAYGKVNTFFMSKVKGQGHIEGQNNIFGNNFGSICCTDFQLVSYCSLWKGKSCMTLTLIFDLDFNKFTQG